MHMLLRGWLYRTLFPGGVPLHAKGQRIAAATVTSAIVKVVSMVHNTIQVCIQLRLSCSAAAQATNPNKQRLRPLAIASTSSPVALHSACNHVSDAVQVARRRRWDCWWHTRAAGVISSLTCAFLPDLLQIPIAIIVLLDPAVNKDTIYASTRLSSFMCLISSGYFLYDFVVVLLRFNKDGAQFLIHAACCLFVYTYAVYSFYLQFYGKQEQGYRRDCSSC